MRLERAKPEIEGDIGVARGAGQVVVIGVPAGGMAPFRLKRDKGVSGLKGGEVEDAVEAGRIGLGRAPCGGQFGL
ncbi:hypothetical protein GALL_532430 [mine drainage metagenome]|uniref:Uncharacterized protein n=1 Tax=mine drainage metagenome TaxID=410659 RepID=A0A1J5P2B3_9ZZZZ